MTQKNILLTLLLLAAAMPLRVNSAELMDITGDYLFYSYDHNYVWGRGNILIRTADCEMRGTSLEINLRTRSMLLTTGCRITCQGGEEKKGDMIRSDLNNMSVILYHFGETIRVTSISGAATRADFSLKSRDVLDESLLYFIGTRFKMRNNFELTGYQVTVFIEGAQSVSFKKFRMDRGVTGKKDLFSLNNLWYTNRSGLITDVSFNYDSGKGESGFSNREYLKLNYDIFKVRSDSPEPKFNLGSETTVRFSDRSSIFLRGSYITGNSGQGMLTWNFKPGDTVKTSLTLDYSDPVSRDAELWVRGEVALDLKKAGQIRVRYNTGKDLGYSGDISYSNRLGRSFSVSAVSGISAVKVSESILNKIADTRLALNYSNQAFNMSANYSLNSDLINNNYRYSPGFILNTTPLPFYGGLLNLGFSSSLLFNKVIRQDAEENSFRSNTALSVTGKNLNISGDTFIDLTGKVEQFFDSDPMENFTTAGIVLRGVHNLSDNMSVELMYNFHTRRETRSWLITGTSTGDLSAMLRLRTPGGKLNTWGSVSYDSELGKYTTGFLNLRYHLIKHWHIQSLVNYDFEFGRLNYSLFLERLAGRILIRASYRSLSRQFQVEIIPR